MKFAAVHIRTPQDRTGVKFDAALEDDGTAVRIRGEYDITFDGTLLTVARRQYPKYELKFREGLTAVAGVETEYGTVAVGYAVKKILFKKSGGDYIWKIGYKLESDEAFGIYGIEAHTSEKES